MYLRTSDLRFDRDRGGVPKMRKFPVLRVFTEIWSQCRFQPSLVPATVHEPGCPARERENDLLGHRH
jgi:hypothetical protein